MHNIPWLEPGGWKKFRILVGTLHVVENKSAFWPIREQWISKFSPTMVDNLSMIWAITNVLLFFTVIAREWFCLITTPYIQSGNKCNTHFFYISITFLGIDIWIHLHQLCNLAYKFLANQFLILLYILNCSIVFYICLHNI